MHQRPNMLPSVTDGVVGSLKFANQKHLTVVARHIAGDVRSNRGRAELTRDFPKPARRVPQLYNILASEIQSSCAQSQNFKRQEPQEPHRIELSTNFKARQ
jgi:hypothetical protein